MFQALFNVRKSLAVAHDVVATVVAVIAAFYIRFEGAGIASRYNALLVFVPFFVLYAGVIYYFFNLYASKWRFASLPDLFNIFRAVTVLAISLVLLDYVLVSSTIYGQFLFGKITIVLYWFLQMFFLGGPRLAYRYFRYTRTRREAFAAGSNPCLILGRAADAELVLRATESGAIRKIRPVGILSPSPSDQGMIVRGVRVLGNFNDLPTVVPDLSRRIGQEPLLIMTPSALEPACQPDVLVTRARELGLEVRQVAGLEGMGEISSPAVRIARINVEDLLLRPSVKIDYRRLEQLVRGKSVVVTGGGGSIGSDICNRALAFGARRLLIIENSELALSTVLHALQTKGSGTIVDGRIADVRDRRRMLQLIGAAEPDLVFHAAALKHIQVVEREWIEGIRTNVFGSVNVADAAAAAGAKVMVMVSTDKAIEPVSVLGATKRLAEIYCQALDAHLGGRLRDSAIVPLNRAPHPTRLISVRFGNVLASNGSVVPRFRAQIEAGGPVTVTDPEMLRYFMTLREASDLVVTAASDAIAKSAADAAVYILNMGQPVRIVDLAERMIRLSGLEPGRDIEIAFTGMRDGERLKEVLFAPDETAVEIGIAGIVAARPQCPPLGQVREWLAALEQGVAREDREAMSRIFQEAVPDFRGMAA